MDIFPIETIVNYLPKITSCIRVPNKNHQNYYVQLNRHEWISTLFKAFFDEYVSPIEDNFNIYIERIKNICIIENIER